MELLRPPPNPMLPESRPFWDGLRQRRLMLPSCRSCGPFFYPRRLCPSCHGRDIEWIEASGKGRLYSFSIVHQAMLPAFKVATPYVLALVELAEGPRLMSNLVEVQSDPERIRIGMPVEVVYEDLGDAATLALFRPARGPAS